MEISFDWPRIHASVLFERETGEKSAQIAARRIESALREECAAAGSVLGTSPALCDRFEVGRETLLEAIRLLEERGVARMRRGRRGGLISLAAPAVDATQLIKRYLAGLRMTTDQLREAGRALQLISVHDLLARQGREAMFTPLFRSLVADGRSPLGKALPREYAGVRITNRSLTPFAEAVDALGAATDDGARCDGQFDGAGKGLVGLAASYLAGEMNRMHIHGAEKLGSEAQLAERIGVSRQVLRQAMRLLEEQGLLACRRGRSNGIVAPATHPASLVRNLSDAFARKEIADAEFRPVLSALDRINRSLFASKAGADRFAALEQITQRKDWRNPAAHIRRMHVEWPVINNPVLSLLEQALSAYRARRAGSQVYVAISDVAALQEKMLAHVDHMRARNLAGADEIYMAMHGQISVMLGAY